MSREKVQAWRDALRVATAGRKIVDKADAAFLAGSGLPPSEGQLARAKELSRLADEALGAAVRSLGPGG